MNRKTAMLFAVPFVLSLIVYLNTVCPTLYTGDSGELASTAYTLGIAHPPGYPLLVLLGRVFLMFSFGNVAFMLNLLSALLASAFTGIMAVLIHALFFRNDYDIKILVICMAGGLLPGFSNALWATAAGFEVYSLGILLMAMTILFLVKADDCGEYSYIIVAAYVFGLSLANHLSAISLLPMMVLFIIKFKPGLKRAAIPIILFVFALTLYLYLPIRSGRNPLFDWNHPANFGSFIEHVTAARYRTYITGFGFDNFFQNLWRSVMILLDQYPVYLLAAGFAGLAVPGVFKKNIRYGLISVLIVNLILSALYDIPDIDQYYLPSVMILTLGLVSFAIFIFSRYFSRVKYALTAVILLIIAPGTFLYNYRANDQSENRLAYIYGENILKSTPRDSFLISVGDNSNSTLYYLRYVENKRADLEIYDSVISLERLRRRLKDPGISNNLSGPELCLQLARSNPQKTFLVKEHMLARGNPFKYYSMDLSPRGLVYGFEEKETDQELWDELVIPEFEDLSRNLDFKGMTMLVNLHLCCGEDLFHARKTREAVEQYRQARKIAESTREASVHNSLGIFFRHEGWPVLARSEYESALSSRHLTADEKANIYVNLGNLEKDNRKFDEAIKYYKDALAIDRDHIEARYNLYLAGAYSDLNKRDFKSAAANFEKALELPDADPHINLNLGVIYDRNLNERSKAVYRYRKFVELYPDSPQAEAAKERIGELESKP